MQENILFTLYTIITANISLKGWKLKCKKCHFAILLCDNSDINMGELKALWDYETVFDGSLKM